MGCASSKPSSSSKSKSKEASNANDNNNKSKQKANAKKAVNANNNNSTNTNALNVDKFEKIKNEQIKIDKNVIDQIEINQNRVIDYIVKVVRKELNAELVKNGAGHNPNFVAVIQAATAAQDNDDLITDIASKAIFLIKTGRCNTTYKNLNDSLRNSHLLCKNQTHKARICDLTVETIHYCLTTLNENKNSNLVDLLNNYENNNNNKLSPDLNNNREDVPNLNNQQNQWDNAVLLSRSEANEVARMLFYSNRARPVIHASPRAKDAYFVNKQLNENVEVTVARDEIDEILHTFNQPIFANNNSNSFQTQLQYFNDDSNNYNINSNNNFEQTPVVSSNNNGEPLSSDARSSNHFNSNNLTERLNEAELEDQKDNSDATAEQQTLINDNKNNTDNLLASVTVIAALTSNLKSDLAEDSNNLVLENNDAILDQNLTDNSNDNTNTVTEFVKQQVSDEDFQSNHVNDINSDNVNNDNVNLNNSETNFEDANTTLNSLNNTNNNVEIEEGKLDPILKQSLLDDRYYNNHAFKEEPPVNGTQNNPAATKIQSNYKGHAERQEIVDDKKAEAAAVTIQATFRGYKTRKEIKPKLKNSKSNFIQTDLATVNEEDDSPKPTTQSNLKSNSIEEMNNNIPEENINNKELDQAAIKIQATYRGFKTRKDLKKDPNKGHLNNHQTHDAKFSLEDLTGDYVELDDHNGATETTQNSDETSNYLTKVDKNDEKSIQPIVNTITEEFISS